MIGELVNVVIDGVEYRVFVVSKAGPGTEEQPSAHVAAAEAAPGPEAPQPAPAPQDEPDAGVEGAQAVEAAAPPPDADPAGVAGAAAAPPSPSQARSLIVLCPPGTGKYVLASFPDASLASSVSPTALSREVVATPSADGRVPAVATAPWWGDGIPAPPVVHECFPSESAGTDGTPESVVRAAAQAGATVLAMFVPSTPLLLSIWEREGFIPTHTGVHMALGAVAAWYKRYCQRVAISALALVHGGRDRGAPSEVVARHTIEATTLKSLVLKIGEADVN